MGAGRNDDDSDAPGAESVSTAAPSVAETTGDRSKERSSHRLERTTSRHLVDASLDEFIARATENELDRTSFVRENREHALGQEIEALKQKLADAEARVTAGAPAAIEVERSAIEPRRQPWGGIVVAFVAGAAIMFAVSLVMRSHDGGPAETTIPPAGSPHLAAPQEPSRPGRPLVGPPSGAHPTVETTGATPLIKAIEVNRIWIRGIIDLIGQK